MKPANLHDLFKAHDLRELDLTALHIVMGTRLAVIWGRAGRDPLPDLATRLGSVPAARALMDLVHFMDQHWPDPFAVARPCMTAMTPDEALLGQCVTAVQCREAGRAWAVMGEFLPHGIGVAFLQRLAVTSGLISRSLHARLANGATD